MRRGISISVLALQLASVLAARAAELMADRFFQSGAMVRQPVGGADEGAIQYREPYAARYWQLAQWGSQASIYGTEPHLLPGGAVCWSNAFKHVVFGPPGSAEGNLVLGVDSIAEYGGVYRDGSVKDWPHLLVSQRISEPQGWFKDYSPAIADLGEVLLDIELKLRHARHVYAAGYDSRLHAAQFLLFFTIQNLRLPSSTNPDYGNYLWFGLRFYDDRDALPGLGIKGDVGTGKLIYNIGIEPFCDTGMQVGEWKRVRGDLLPHIKAGLQAAWSRGYLTNSFDYADYKIGGMNMGWEVPGLSDVAMQVRNFGLQAYGLHFARPYEFNIQGDAEGWSFTNLVQLHNGPNNGQWIFKAPGDDPHLVSPPLRMDAGRFQRVQVGIANAGNPPEAGTAQLFWRRKDDADFSIDRCASVPVGNGGGWQTRLFDLRGHPEWTGEIVQLRLDPILFGDDHAVGIDFIRPIAGDIVPGEAPPLNIDPPFLWWDAEPWRQYTLRQAASPGGPWTAVPGAAALPHGGPFMFHALDAGTLPAAVFYRLDVSAGP